MITKFDFKSHTIKSYAIRKLTPLECFRLMGVRDDVIYTMQSTNAEAAERVQGWKGKGKAEDMAISASQQYKQAGNSICINVLVFLYEQLWYPKNEKREIIELQLFPEMKLPSEPVDKSKGEKVIITTFSGYDSQLMDIAQTSMDCPATKLLGVMVEEDIYRLADKLRTRLAGIVTGKDEEIDLNADSNVNTAGVNLLNALSNTEQMKGLLQDYFEYRDSAE